jgi:hypothetical protein
MTRSGIGEYAAAVRERYARAGRSEKGRILTACCATTGSHRKAAIRRLRAPSGGPSLPRTSSRSPSITGPWTACEAPPASLSASPWGDLLRVTLIA